MIRNPNRQLTRLFFSLVIVMGLLGGLYASRNWQPDLGALETTSLGEETDWIDFLATLGEEAVQLFLGFTSEN